jgi:3D (Asp-Asp-Asp) domain-containing protein
MGEVGLFALLIMLVSSFAILRPGFASTSGKPAALSLVNITMVKPDKVRQAVAVPPIEPTPEQPHIEQTDVQDEEAVHYYNGRPLRLAKRITMLTTAYSPDARSCGKWADGFTASGYSVWTNGMKLVAADTSILPFGTLVSIPGYNGGRPVPVLDRGGKIKGKRLDLLYPTHEVALKWGAQRLTVDVWEYAD